MAAFRTAAPDDATLSARFDGLLARDPAAIAVIDPDGTRWSREAITMRAEPVLAQLMALDIGASDRVLVRTDRSAATAACALAVSRLGAAFCCAPPGPAGDLAVRLGAGAAIACGEDGGIAVTAVDARRGAHRPGCALIACTSGSTGSPKFVMHGSAALNYVTRACAEAAGLRRDEAIFAAIAPDSAAGFAFSIHFALALGHPLVLAPRWDPVDAMRRITAHDCRWSTMVPTQLLAMVEATREGLWTGRLPLRAIAVGGSAMTAALIDDARRSLGVSALRMFGMSECLAHCSVRLSDPEPRRMTSDGRPFPGTEIEAFDALGNALPRGERGQAGVRGPSLFLGYAGGFGGDDEPFTADGFLLTGDQIVRDADGYVQVVGRLKDQIIRGGFNIDPAEIEAVVGLHPAVAEVVVVPVPDVRLGEMACAVVRATRGAAAPDLDAIRALLADAGVYRRKWPERVVAIDVWPRLANGKVDRRAIARLAAGSGG